MGFGFGGSCWDSCWVAPTGLKGLWCWENPGPCPGLTQGAPLALWICAPLGRTGYLPAKYWRGRWGTGSQSTARRDCLWRRPFPGRGHPWMPQRGMAYQPRARPWGRFDSQPVRSKGRQQGGRWGQRWPRVGMRRSFRTRGSGALVYPGPCPGLVCAAPLGQSCRHLGGYWRWDNHKPPISNSLLLCNLRGSYSGGNCVPGNLRARQIVALAPSAGRVEFAHLGVEPVFDEREGGHSCPPAFPEGRGGRECPLSFWGGHCKSPSMANYLANCGRVYPGRCLGLV